MSWFTCFLILFVVAVPVSHLKASPKKGNMLLLWWELLCMCPSNEGYVMSRLIAEMMEGLQEMYMSLMVSSSTCSGDSKWVGAAGQWLRNCSSWCFYLLVCWNISSDIPSVLVIHVQWLSMSGALDRLSKLVGKELILQFPLYLRWWHGWSCISCCNEDECWLFTVLNVWVMISVNHEYLW